MDSGTRDRELERELLAIAPPDFERRVLARLDRAGAELGRDLPDSRTLAELLSEAREECEDIAGWLLMAIQVAAPRLSPLDLAELRGAAIAAIDQASGADSIISALADSLAAEGRDSLAPT